MRKKQNKKNAIILCTSIIVIIVLAIIFKLNLHNRIINKIQYEVKYSQTVSKFKKDNGDNKEIVFVGDSITAGNDWSKSFPNSINRGISGDTIERLSKRLDYLGKNPKKIVLLIGVNSLSKSTNNDQVFTEYNNLIKEIEKKYPNAQLIINKVLYINEPIYYEKNPNATLSNKEIEDFNAKLTENYSGKYTIIDLNEKVADKNNNLEEKYTIDGLHLNQLAYKSWIEKLKEINL